MCSSNSTQTGRRSPSSSGRAFQPPVDECPQPRAPRKVMLPHREREHSAAKTHTALKKYVFHQESKLRVAAETETCVTSSPSTSFPLSSPYTTRELTTSRTPPSQPSRLPKSTARKQATKSVGASLGGPHFFRAGNAWGCSAPIGTHTFNVDVSIKRENGVSSRTGSRQLQPIVPNVVVVEPDS